MRGNGVEDGVAARRKPLLAQRDEAFVSILEAVRLSRRHHWPLANHAAMLARGWDGTIRTLDEDNGEVPGG